MKSLVEAVKELKANSKAKFDETVELHINLNLDVKQADQQIRTTTTLPHGTGKELTIAVFADEKVPEADLQLSDEDLVKLEKGDIKPSDFDILIVEPKNMAKLGKLGAILGPAGVMPNPKSGTVTDKVAETVKQFKKGKLELRTEQNHPIIHTTIGKVSFEEKNLIENFKEIYSTLKSTKPQKAKPDWIRSIFISSSMGKSIEVDISEL